MDDVLETAVMITESVCSRSTVVVSLLGNQANKQLLITTTFIDVLFLYLYILLLQRTMQDCPLTGWAILNPPRYFKRAKECCFPRVGAAGSFFMLCPTASTFTKKTNRVKNPGSAKQQHFSH